MNWDYIFPMLLVLGCLVAVMYAAFRTIKGDLAEKNWQATQNDPLNRWFFQGMTKERYVKQQRVAAWLMIPFLIALFSVVVLGACQE